MLNGKKQQKTTRRRRLQCRTRIRHEASQSLTTTTAPCDDATGSSAAPIQSRRATLIAGGVAAGTQIEIREKKGRFIYSRARLFEPPHSSLSLSTLSTSSQQQKKKQQPSPRSPPAPSSPSRTRTPSAPPSARATSSTRSKRRRAAGTTKKRSRPSSSSSLSGSSPRAAPSRLTGRPTSARSWENEARSPSRPGRRSRTSSRSSPPRKRAGKKKKARRRARARARRRLSAAGTRARRPPTPSASRTSGSPLRSPRGWCSRSRGQRISGGG